MRETTRAIMHRCTLWTLCRNGETTRATILETEGAGLELRYTRDGKPFLRRVFADGADLLREAAIERFDLERDGWTAHPRAAGNAAQPNAVPLARRRIPN